MKRLITLWLVAGMLLSLVSCSSEEPVETEFQSETESVADESPSETDRSQIKDTLPDSLNFAGQTVTFLVREGDMLEWKDEMFVEETSGDVVISAVYDRNLKVEDRLQVNMEFVEMPGVWDQFDKFLTEVQNSVTSGDQLYDVVAGYRHYMPKLAVNNYLLNLHEVPYIDFAQPWWKGNFTEELTIDGKLHFMAGDIGYSLLKCMLVIFYNKDLAAEFGVGDLYSKVLDGTWTIDAAMEICKNAYIDTDGNGSMEWGNDVFSFYTNHVQEMMDIWENPFTAADAEGTPQFVFNNEKTQSIVEKLDKFMYETPGVISWSEVISSGGDFIKIFPEGRSMMWAHCLVYAENMREMEDDFGILPYYKWDEQQQNYNTAVQNNCSIFSIVQNCENLESTGAVVEAMAAESYRTVTPAYYDVALQRKYTRDEESLKMLEIIRDGVVFNFGSIFSIELNGIYNTLSTINMERLSFSSYYAANETNLQSALDSLIETYRAME